MEMRCSGFSLDQKKEMKIALSGTHEIRHEIYVKRFPHSHFMRFENEYRSESNKIRKKAKKDFKTTTQDA
ncbi:CLUMA_CG016099, isoform A [Clunio marinus]|uniref:CLUMA_CG016099, isoform A n=1 Tax=Clunio marinus TaxID=568069 RepID=A0A1J1IQW1_9DIPT|nr:CLUMA_CG016099, isoform A [Clunio marinus]